MNNRELAIKWWNGENTNQSSVMDFYYPNRESSSLTGREIEAMWYNEVANKAPISFPILLTLDEAIAFSNWCDKNYTYKKGHYVNKTDSGKKKHSINKKDLYLVFKNKQNEKNTNLADGNAIDSGQLPS
jgi:hypothetical protein